MKSCFRALVILTVFFSCSVQAQNPENRLFLGFGVQGANMSFGDASSNYYKNWDLLPVVSQLRVFGYITKGFSIGWQLGVGKATRSDSTYDKFFLQWGIDTKYSLANGYILRQSSWFEPYLIAGAGLSKWGNVKGSLNFGAGLNLWVTKTFAFFGQAQFNYLPHSRISPEANDPRPSFMLHSFGFALRLSRAKDSDKDGIPDDRDACPNDPGKPELNGCPDTDNDGIVDKDDKCPTVAGLREFQGCPDTDRDGIPDPEDECPNDSGSIAAKGCPDRDGDAIPDIEDACPDQPGTLLAKGCPDRDADGVRDKDDDCPDVQGPAKYRGCPDSDGDGIIDKLDKCPNVFGVAENNGCPLPVFTPEKRIEVQNRLNFAARKIFFETGKDVLLDSSGSELDSVVAILHLYEFLKVSIDGYTDSIGNVDDNLLLSQKRADAVERYFVNHGILVTRLTATGFGQSHPIAGNASEKGRALNRRVELNIKD